MATFKVTDPAGIVHTKGSKARVYTHAVIRRPAGRDYFIVSFASSETAAVKESRVLTANYDYIQVVQTEEQEK